MSRVSIKISADSARAALTALNSSPDVEGIGAAIQEISGALARHDRYASKPRPSKSSPDCQWCGKDILSEPCGPSHRMRQRLALAKTRKQGRR